MNNVQDLTQLWAAQEKQLQQSVRLNTITLNEIKTHKAQHKMRGYLGLNVFSLIVGVLMASFSSYFIFTHLDAIHMLLSGAVALVWSLLIFVAAILQLEKLYTLDYTKPVLEVQHKLNVIRLSALYFLRVSLMILPFYFAYLLMFFDVVFGVDIYVSGDTNWLISQAAFSLLLGVLALYLYRQLSPENINKPLTKWLMQGFGSQAMEAAEELNQLEEFESFSK
jgi:MFS family permease